MYFPLSGINVMACFKTICFPSLPKLGFPSTIYVPILFSVSSILLSLGSKLTSLYLFLISPIFLREIYKQNILLKFVFLLIKIFFLYSQILPTFQIFRFHKPVYSFKCKNSSKLLTITISKLSFFKESILY